MHHRYQERFKLLLIFLIICSFPCQAQMITGTWKGKINRQKVEVKIIQQGDSLTGTSYYYESHNNYRRYAIRGYFDEATNSAVWWDDQLIEEKSSKFGLSTPGRLALLSRADFNCPGGGRMMLDGKASLKEDEEEPKGEVHLDKSNQPVFEDEWDYVIDNFMVGGNDPRIIDSIEAIPYNTTIAEAPVSDKDKENQVYISIVPAEEKKPEIPKERKTVKNEDPVIKAPPVKPVQTIEEKFVKREKVLVKEITLTGDSLELRFYDNAEIDGDSISLFLNNKLLFQHILLTGKAHIVKIAVSELNESNELIMVAENLGAIPPNTSYMLAICGEKRYDAYLASTEGSSAMIRFIKEKK